MKKTVPYLSPSPSPSLQLGSGQAQGEGRFKGGGQNKKPPLMGDNTNLLDQAETLCYDNNRIRRRPALLAEIGPALVGIAENSTYYPFFKGVLFFYY